MNLLIPIFYEDAHNQTDMP